MFTANEWSSPISPKYCSLVISGSWTQWSWMKMNMQTQGIWKYETDSGFQSHQQSNSPVGPSSIDFVQLVNHLSPTLQNIWDDSCKKIEFSFQDCDLTQSQLSSAQRWIRQPSISLDLIPAQLGLTSGCHYFQKSRSYSFEMTHNFFKWFQTRMQSNASNEDVHLTLLG